MATSINAEKEGFLKAVGTKCYTAVNPQLKQLKHPRRLAPVIAILLLLVVAILAYLTKNQCQETCAMTPLKEVKAGQRCTPRVISASLAESALGYYIGNPEIQSDGISGASIESINGTFGNHAGEIGFDCDIFPETVDLDCDDCKCVSGSDSATVPETGDHCQEAGMTRTIFPDGAGHNIAFEYTRSENKNGFHYSLRLKTNVAHEDGGVHQNCDEIGRCFRSEAVQLCGSEDLSVEKACLEDITQTDPNLLVGHYGFTKAASASCCKYQLNGDFPNLEEFSCINSVTHAKTQYNPRPKESFAAMQKMLYADKVRWEQQRTDFMVSRTLDCCHDVCPSWLSAVGSALGYQAYAEIALTIPILLLYRLIVGEKMGFGELLAIAREAEPKTTDGELAVPTNSQTVV